MDHLSRTVFTGVSPDWTEKQVAERIAVLTKAGKAV
jgi:hypothetical protein